MPERAEGTKNISASSEDGIGRLRQLRMMAEKSQRGDGLGFLDTREGVDEVLRNVEQVLIPSLDSGHDIRNCLLTVCSLCAAHIHVKQENNSLEGKESSESIEFSQKLTRILLRNSDVFVSLARNKIFLPEALETLCLMFDRAREVGTYEYTRRKIEDMVNSLYVQVKNELGPEEGVFNLLY